MILVDTGALYALGDRKDTHHEATSAYFRQARRREVLASRPVLTEAGLLIEARLGMRPVRALWDDILDGVFELVACFGGSLGACPED